MPTLHSIETRMRNFQKKRRGHLVFYRTDIPDEQFDAELAEFKELHAAQLSDPATLLFVMRETYTDANV